MKLEKKVNNEEHLDIDLENIFVQKPEYIERSYAELAAYRCIFITEDFTKEMASAVVALLLHYNEQSEIEPITIYINSNGGDGAALMAICDTIDLIEASVETICMGKCYSAGAFLLAAGTKGRRYVFKHSQVMIHECQVQLPPDDQENSKLNYALLNIFNNKVLDILAKNTGHSIKQIKEDCKKDLYFNAKETIEYGLADYILI